jgi:hypothetical protein
VSAVNSVIPDRRASASASERQLLRVGVALMVSVWHGCSTIIVWAGTCVMGVVVFSDALVGAGRRAVGDPSRRGVRKETSLR